MDRCYGGLRIKRMMIIVVISRSRCRFDFKKACSSIVISFNVLLVNVWMTVYVAGDL